MKSTSTCRDQQETPFRFGHRLLPMALLLVPLTLQADVPAPQINQFRLNPDSSITLSWSAAPDTAYTVLTSSNLSGVWLPVDYIIAVSNSVTWKTLGQSGPTRFFKLATEAIEAQNLEPSIAPSGTGTDIYITGQGFGSNDVVRLIGPGGPIVLTNRVIVSSTLIRVSGNPTFTPDVPGDYGLEIVSGSTGKKTTLSYAWTLVPSPSDSRALLESPEEPLASPATRGNARGKGAINLGTGEQVRSGEKRNSKGGIKLFDGSNNLTITPSNCGANPPVICCRLFSGEIQLQAVDLEIQGRGLDFVLGRFYRSRTGQKVTLDDRWTLSYDVSVTQTADGISVADGSGRTDLYYAGTNGVYSRNESFNAGTLSNNTFTLAFPDTGRWEFNSFNGLASAGKLSRSVDRNGNTMAFSYDGFGRLAEIVDDLGRTNHFAYNGLGQLATVTDCFGRVVTYQYYGSGEIGGSPGDLKSVTCPSVTATPNTNDFPNGKTVTYTYSTGYTNDAENHLLLSVTDGKGQISHRWVYQHNQTDLQFLRCISEQSGDTNDDIYYSYQPVVADPTNRYATMIATVRDAIGNVSECSYDARNRKVLQRDYTGRAPLNQPTTASSNRPVNKLRSDDPDYYDTSWAWNNDSLCVKKTQPSGVAIISVYQRSFDKTTSPAKKGDLRVLREAPGCGDVNGDGDFVTRYDYDPRFGSPGLNVFLFDSLNGNGRSRPLGSNAQLIDPSTSKASSCKGWDGTIKGLYSDPAARGPRQTVSLDGTYNSGRDIDAKVQKKWLPANFRMRIDGLEMACKGWDETIKGSAREILGVWGSTHAKPLTRQARANPWYADADSDGFATTVTDARGNTTAATYDSAGNCVRITAPLGARVDCAYNAYGQVVAITNAPDANGYRSVDLANYYSAGPQKGFLQSCVADSGGINLTTTYEYDARQNLTHCTDPRTNDWLYVYNELDQLVQSSSPALGASSFRITTQYTYDAADNLTRIDHENRDFTGAFGSNTVWRTQFVYDLQNRLSGCWRDKNGNLVLRCNEIKYDANDNIVLYRSGEAVNGNDTNKIVAFRYDERDLLYQYVAAPGTAVASTNQYDYTLDATKTTPWKHHDIQGLDAPEQERTVYAYDGHNRCIGITDPMSNIVTYVYDPNNNLVYARVDGQTNDIAGSNGNLRLAETRSTYDALDRRVQQLDSFFDVSTGAPIGSGVSSTTFIYAPNGQLLSVTDDNHHAITCAYDTAGRLSSVLDPKGSSLSYTYDNDNNVVTVTQTDKSDLSVSDQVFVATAQYDGLNRCTQTSNNVGNTEQYFYDSRDNIVRQIDANGNVSGWSYDGLNRVEIAVADLDRDGVLDAAIDRTLRYVYDDNDCLLSCIDPNTNTVTYSYDQRDRLFQAQAPVGTHHTLFWTAVGDLRACVDPNGTAVTNIYDGLGRLIHRDIAPGPGVASTTTFETFAYDGCSRLVSASNNISRTDLTYDSMGNLIRTTQDGLTTSRTYDGIGNCLSVTYPSGRVVQYAYDVLDQVTNVNSGSQGAQLAVMAQYAYEGPGRLGRIVRPLDGVHGANTRIFWNGTVNPANPAGDFGWMQPRAINQQRIQGGPIIDQRLVAYDRNQNKILRAQTAPFVAGQNTLTNRWEYNPLNQLSRAINTTGTGATVRAYHIDPKGNRIDVTNGPTIETYSRSSTVPPGDFQLDQYTSSPYGVHSYDHNGNLIQTATATGQTAFLFDALDRLVEVDDLTSGTPSPIVTYSYDALDHRISKNTGGTTTQFVYGGDDCDDKDDVILEERSPAGITTHIVHPPGSPPGTYRRISDVRLVHPPGSPPGFWNRKVSDVRIVHPPGTPPGTWRRLSDIRIVHPPGTPPGTYRSISDVRIVHPPGTPPGWWNRQISDIRIVHPPATPPGRYHTMCVTFSATAGAQFYYCDDIGNILAVTDSAGNVLGRFEYGDYGDPTFLSSDGIPLVDGGGQPVTSSPIGISFLFRGMRWESEIGLYCDKRWSTDPYSEDTMRFFDPKLGRYLNGSGVLLNGSGTYLNGEGAVTPYTFENDNPWGKQKPNVFGKSKEFTGHVTLIK